MTFNPFGSRSKTKRTINSSIFRLQWTPNIIRLTKCPIDSTALFLSPQTARATNSFFERQIASVLPPHSRTTGFMYGVLDAGVKYAHILIAGNDRLETFDFALPVPGPAFVGTGVRADSIYPGQKIEDLDLDSVENHALKVSVLHDKLRCDARR